MHRLLFFFILLVARVSFAQQPTLSHYPVNPLLINPAFAGHKGLSHIAINQRQQWIGINDAPSVSTFQLSTAFGTRIGAGISAQRFTRGAIHSNTFNGIFAYKVPFGRTTGLTFGLSGGVSTTGINKKSTYNPADPVIAAFLENQLHPDLKFGINYHLKDFNLGLTFTDMIYDNIYRSNQTDYTDVKFYENYIVNFDYRFKIPASKFIIEPFALYTADLYSSPYFEGGSLFRYDELLYLGGSYRQDYGASILSGLQIKKLSVGYAYEVASQLVNSLGQGSHEIQLSFRFGKVLSEEKKAPKIKQPKVEEEIKAPAQDELVKESDVPQINRDEEFTRLEEVPGHTFYYKGIAQNELPVGFYIIAGAYKTAERAQKRTAELSKQSLFAAHAYNSESQLHYVYVYRSDRLEKTSIARDNYRKKASLEDAWLLEIKEK